jgi:hypothetical protein
LQEYVRDNPQSACFGSGTPEFQSLVMTPDGGEAGIDLDREGAFVRSDLPTEWDAAVKRPSGADEDTM